MASIGALLALVFCVDLGGGTNDALFAAQRSGVAHAPAVHRLGPLGSMLFFTIEESRPVLHEILSGVFMTLHTPVTYLLLVRAALHRDRPERTDP